VVLKQPTSAPAIAGLQPRVLQSPTGDEDHVSPGCPLRRHDARVMNDDPFDPRARAEEKQRSREEDSLALARGEKTCEELRRENGLFVFPHVFIDLDGAESLA
jgi:hypothetical protein